MFRKTSLWLMALLVVAVVAVACQPEIQQVEVPVEVTRVVTETIVEEGEEVEVTRVVTEEIMVEVTPVAQEAPEEEEDMEEEM